MYIKEIIRKKLRNLLLGSDFVRKVEKFNHKIKKLKLSNNNISNNQVTKELINHCCIKDNGAVIYPEAKIQNSSNIKDNIIIGEQSHILGTLLVWENCGKIQIGKSTYIGDGSKVYSAKSIKIGDRVQIAHDCNIFDNNIHSLNPYERYEEFMHNVSKRVKKLYPLNEKEVIIEDDAWIGANVSILKGVKIGKGAIVGIGSVVVKDVDDYEIVVGNPARVIKKLNFNNIT